jgi:hypothetical protein
MHLFCLLRREEQGLRKKYFNAMEELKGGIRVFARVRPLSERERADKHPVALSLPDEYTLEHAWKNEKRTYAYNAVFGPESTQEQVFEQVKDLCQSALDGYNVVCFAYGQTGAHDSQHPAARSCALMPLRRDAQAAARRSPCPATTRLRG